MKNASRTARYMMMARSRGGENYRNEYNVGDINYSVDNRFRDRRGREHYDNGRFAPMRNEYNMNYGMERGGQDYRNEYDGGTDNRTAGRGNGYGESRRGVRNAFDDDEDMEMRGRMIGFGDRSETSNQYYPPPWYNETEANYGGRMENHHGMDMERHKGMKEGGGASGSGMGLTEEKAKQWVKHMKGDEGTGEHWNMDQIKRLMTQKGVDADYVEMYAIMNALYSDYCKVFKKYGVTSPDFYMELAQAWLNDKDAVKDKALVYYENVVKH